MFTNLCADPTVTNSILFILYDVVHSEGVVWVWGVCEMPKWVGDLSYVFMKNHREMITGMGSDGGSSLVRIQGCCGVVRQFA